MYIGQKLIWTKIWRRLFEINHEGGVMNWIICHAHIRSILNNLLDMGFIETMGRPRKKSERKNSTGHPLPVSSKLKTTLSEVCFGTPKYPCFWSKRPPFGGHHSRYIDLSFEFSMALDVYWLHTKQIIDWLKYVSTTYDWIIFNS